MKSKSLCLFLVSVIFLFSACGGRSESRVPPASDNHSEKQTDSMEKEKVAESEKDGENQQKPKTEVVEQSSPPHQDVDGMAEVVLEADGGASLILHPEKWPDLSVDFGEYNMPAQGDKQGLRLPINGLSGKVKQTCVGKLLGFVEADRYEAVSMPVIILLMEDGSLEWLLADPYWLIIEPLYGYDEIVYSWGILPWINDIVALSYESEKEGKGEMTIMATDQKGKQYDLRKVLTLQGLLWNIWRFDLEPDGERHMILDFTEDGTVRLEKGTGLSVDEAYLGNYQVHFEENSEKGEKAGTISFDFKRASDKSVNIADSPKEIQGNYFVEMNENWELKLWLSEGDPLHQQEGEPVQEYIFYAYIEDGEPIDFAEVSEEELIDYLFMVVPEAKRLVEEEGMSAMVMGETTEFEDGDICRDVWLGTNSSDSFVKEILYTISSIGEVFQYDPVGDGWIYP